MATKDEGSLVRQGHHEPKVHSKRETKPAKRNINLDAAFVHVLSDAIQSAGVMFAAGLIWYEPSWTIADPLCTFLFSVMVLYTTLGIMGQGIHVLMEGSPDGIETSEVHKSLEDVEGVLEVHDLHIWSLTVGKASLSVHLHVDDRPRETTVLQAATEMLSKKYNIHHTTIQVETRHDKVFCNPYFDSTQAGTADSRSSSSSAEFDSIHFPLNRTMSPTEFVEAQAEQDWAELGIKV